MKGSRMDEEGENKKNLYPKKTCCTTTTFSSIFFLFFLPYLIPSTSPHLWVLSVYLHT